MSLNMKIEIRTINKIPAIPLKATANIIFDDCFIIRNVRIVETENGRFISMPSVKGRDDKFRNTCHPLTTEFHKTLTAAVLEAYDLACVTA